MCVLKVMSENVSEQRAIVQQYLEAPIDQKHHLELLERTEAKVRSLERTAERKRTGVQVLARARHRIEIVSSRKPCSRHLGSRTLE